MAVRFNGSKKNTIADAAVSGLTHLDIYTGSQPASADLAATGTLLATVSSLTWGAAVGGTVSLSNTPSSNATVAGTAGWGRFRNSTDTIRMDGVVNGEFFLAVTALEVNTPVVVTSAMLIQG